MHKCLGENCSKIITYRFALCRECEKRYGKSPKQWPKWLRFLWNDIQRERRQQIRASRMEVPLRENASYDRYKE